MEVMFKLGILIFVVDNEILLEYIVINSVLYISVQCKYYELATVVVVWALGCLNCRLILCRALPSFNSESRYCEVFIIIDTMITQSIVIFWLLQAAALDAKKRGEIEQAKEYLRNCKGFQSLIEATQAGLPVDMNTVSVYCSSCKPMKLPVGCLTSLESSSWCNYSIAILCLLLVRLFY